MTEGLIAEDLVMDQLEIQLQAPTIEREGCGEKIPAAVADAGFVVGSRPC